MIESTRATTVIDRPLVSFGREVCGDLAAGLRREWLVTNGLGGYASSTLAGINTRRYHGLLVAALTPPVERTVLVGGLVEWATYDGRRYPLSAHEYGGGTIDPHGYRHLQSFRLEGMLPVWMFAIGDALLERRVWMAYGANTTYLTYRMLTQGVSSTRPLDLEITPLVTYRDFHALTSGYGWQPNVEAQPRRRSSVRSTTRSRFGCWRMAGSSTSAATGTGTSIIEKSTHAGWTITPTCTRPAASPRH
jgi:glycogen debranching enzyme